MAAKQILIPGEVVTPVESEPVAEITPAESEPVAIVGEVVDRPKSWKLTEVGWDLL